MHLLFSFSKPSQAQELPGERKLSCPGVEELAATRAVCPISDSAPLGVPGPNPLLGESHVCSKRTIWGKLCPDTTTTMSHPVMDFTGISIKSFFALLYLCTKMFMSMWAFLSWPTTEKGKKRDKERVKVTALTVSL